MITRPRNRPPRPTMVAAIVVTALLASACAGGSETTDADAGPDSGAATTLAGAGDDPGSDGAGIDDDEPTVAGPAQDGDGVEVVTGESTTTETTGAAEADDEPTLAGEPFDIGPPIGQVLAVVGVAHDDVLNFRMGPDPSADLVDTVAPGATSPQIVSSGGGRLLPNAAWWQVTVDGQEAWANLAYLGMLGVSDDALDELLTAGPGETAPTIEAYVDALAASRAAGPEPRTELVTPVEGLDADGATVTVDVIGLGDDAVKGERYVLTFSITFDDPDDPSREPISYTLVGAERTVICGRGLAEGGLCA